MKKTQISTHDFPQEEIVCDAIYTLFEVKYLLTKNHISAGVDNLQLSINNLSQQFEAMMQKKESFSLNVGDML